MYTDWGDGDDFVVPVSDFYVDFLVNISQNKGKALDIAPQVDTATAEALRYMARTKQRRTYLPIYLPSYSRYSFTDPERMEG